MFCQLILRPGQFCGVNLDDHSDYFHNLREEDRAPLRNHLGTTYTPKELVSVRIKYSSEEMKCDSLELVLCALPTGSTHAVDLAKGYHEGLLRSQNALRYQDLSHYC